VRIVDTWDGTFYEVVHDRASEGGPSFSPDGRFLFFHSDRTGIPNIYAYKIANKRLLQVTNITTGAFQPEVSPDGKPLAYIGYTSTGFDLYAMELDEGQWLEPLPYLDDRPPVTPAPPHNAYRVREYRPLETVLPRRYSVQIQPGDFGQQVTINVSQS